MEDAMPDGGEAITVRILRAIDEISAEDWDDCAAGDPFTRHAFLSSLEDSGSATGETGWLPQHLVAEDAGGRVLGVAPMYLKSHSYGEYVFDWGWADAYERAGGRYYPKLQVAVPFTPATGRRLLVRSGATLDVEAALIGGVEQIAKRAGISSIHVTFPTEHEWARLGEAGWLQRIGEQFHWRNRGYDSFDGFLDALASRKRKAIRKERRQVEESGVRLHALSGDDLKSEHWDAFYAFYTRTSDRKWGYPYLTREFFDLLDARMAEDVVLMMAEHDGMWIAGALNLKSADTLFGRNWGCLEEYRFLHFEACYYQAIDYAIEHGLARVEAGAQGPHKIQRGYEPIATYSAHWIADPALRHAVENFLRRERDAVEGEIAYLDDRTPFRRAPDGSRIEDES